MASSVWALSAALAMGGGATGKPLALAAGDLQLTAEGGEVHLGDVSLRATSFGRAGASHALAVVGQHHDGTTLHLDRGVVDEWYRVVGRGIEQGFTIAAPPPGSGRVELDLSITGASVASAGSGLDLVSALQRVHVDELTVVDADGRTLPATLEPTRDGVRVSFLDEGARYPVIVDPYYSTVTPITPSGKGAADSGCLYYSMRAAGTRAFLGLTCALNNAVYVFRYNGTNLVEDQRIVPLDPQSSSQFGKRIATDDSGLRVIVGAPGIGAVYAFASSGTTFTQEQKITAPGGTTFFGEGIAYGANGSGGDLVIYGLVSGSTPTLFFYARSGSTYTLVNQVTSLPATVPGSVVALSQHRALDVAGSDLHELSQPATLWAPRVKVGTVSSVFDTNDFGTHAIFGRQAYEFDGTNWNAAGTLTTTGSDYSVSVNGNYAVLGSNFADGRLSLHSFSGGTWTQYASIFPPSSGASFYNGIIDGSHVLSSDDSNVRWVTVLPTKANGTACAANNECTSGSCADGVCCDTACMGGACVACTTAKKGTGADGVCGNVVDGAPGRGGCTNAGTICGPDGKCNGSGTCRAGAPKGTSCGTTSCSAGSLTGPSCTGTGSCSTTPVSCSPFICKDGTSCFTACSSDVNCASPNVCVAGTCRAKLANGEATPAASACVSGFAADGVCCDAACTGACEACTVAKKGSGMDGKCGPVAAGSDPDSECKSRCMGSAVVGKGTCDGSGKCGDGASTSCAPFGCESGACKTKCFDESDCSGATCDTASGNCIAKSMDAGVDSSVPDVGSITYDGGAPLVTGSAQGCTDASQCASGFCVDGVCCDSACTDTCSSCALPFAPGKCSLVPAGLDPRHQCGPDRSCHSTCNGAGACMATRAGDQCAPARCTDVSHGVGPATCPALDGACPDTSTPFDCGNYACLPAFGACATRCGSSVDCASGNVCDTPSGQCAPAPPEDSGGCALGRRPESSLLALAALGLALGIARRGRTQSWRTTKNR